MDGWNENHDTDRQQFGNSSRKEREISNQTRQLASMEFVFLAGEYNHARPKLDDSGRIPRSLRRVRGGHRHTPRDRRSDLRFSYDVPAISGLGQHHFRSRFIEIKKAACAVRLMLKNM